MRLASYSHKNTAQGSRGIGLIDGDGPDTVLRPLYPPSASPMTLRDVLRGGPEAMADLHARTTGAPAVPLSDTRLHAPIARPGKILAIGLNYRAHVAETGREVSPHQIWFNKQRTCVIGPYDAIEKPVVSDMVDYEGELVVVIGRRCRHVPAARAHEVIAGYMVGNDVSVRDWQRRTPTMQMGKSFDTHGPTGPWLVTADEIADPQALTLTTWVNGAMRQRASTAEMIHPITEQIAHLTTAFTLEPGDLIFTGTPQGVGMAMDPPAFLQAGDSVRVEISGIGAIDNPVVAERAQLRID